MAVTDRLPTASRRWHVSKSHRKATPLILTLTTTPTPSVKTHKKTAMLRFLTTIKVITTKQRNKFKNNNREGGDKRGEKAPFPSGAHKQQEPVSLWQHLQTFLLLSQKYLMLMLQCDASAAVLSQRTFDLASSWLPKRKNTLLTDCVWHLSWQKYSEREKKKRGGRGRGKWRSGRGWSMCEIVCLKKIIRHSLGKSQFSFFHNKEDRGGFPVIVTLCKELRVAY